MRLRSLRFFSSYTRNKISDYAYYAVLLSPLLKWNIWLRSLRCFSSLTTLTTLFYFTTIKMKYLTTLTTLFFFTDYTHYAVFLHWLHSLHCFTSLLVNGNLWLRLRRCFSSLTTLTTLFYFTAIKMKYLTTLTKLFFFAN